MAQRVGRLMIVLLVGAEIGTAIVMWLAWYWLVACN